MISFWAVAFSSFIHSLFIDLEPNIGHLLLSMGSWVKGYLYVYEMASPLKVFQSWRKSDEWRRNEESYGGVSEEN